MQRLADEPLTSLPKLASVCRVTQTSPRNERRILPGAVRRIRKIQQLTQDTVATRAGVDQHGRAVLDHTTVSHIESGRRQPSLEVMCQLATGLGCDLDDITYMVNIYVVEPVAS